MTLFMRLRQLLAPTRRHDWGLWELSKDSGFGGALGVVIQRRRCRRCGLYQEATLQNYSIDCDDTDHDEVKPVEEPDHDGRKEREEENVPTAHDPGPGPTTDIRV